MAAAGGVAQHHGPKGTERSPAGTRPAGHIAPEGIVVVCFGALYLLVLGAACVRRRLRVTWLLPLVWLYLAWTHVRHASLFGIAAGLTLADMLPETAWAERAIRRGSDLFDAARGRLAQSTGLLPFTVPALVVVAAFVLKTNGVVAPGGRLRIGTIESGDMPPGTGGIAERVSQRHAGFQ